ncbi:hypothetical protein NGRA_2700 [Nosema granulosis]|uniref:Uncharacterized protein n=1 Tax=Nosema granulosis TaxID=83296 RepID=A0A9P6KXW4_9MICR|nr:hypothetical protein NGRA_2700 [Nosema granulosis]
MGLAGPHREAKHNRTIGSSYAHEKVIRRSAKLRHHIYKVSIAAETTHERDFSEMLKDASVLNERKLISTTALAQMIVQKVPSDIKALLYQTSCVVSTWEEFIQKDEEIAWIAFPDKMLSRVSAHYTQTTNNARKYQMERDFNKPRNTQQSEY